MQRYRQVTFKLQLALLNCLNVGVKLIQLSLLGLQVLGQAAVNQFPESIREALSRGHDGGWQVGHPPYRHSLTEK